MKDNSIALVVSAVVVVLAGCAALFADGRPRGAGANPNGGSPTRIPEAAPRSVTSASYSLSVGRICGGAVMFSGTHEIGTRSGAIAVADDIRATGGRRLRRVAALPRPRKTRMLVRRWISVEHSLVAMYATDYLSIWNAIERAVTPRRRAALPAVLTSLVRDPERLQRRAVALESALNVPDCTGGLPTKAVAPAG